MLELEDECVSYAENKMECSLLARTITATFWELDTIDNPPAYPLTNSTPLNNYPLSCHHALSLPRGPVTSITSVTDAAAAAITYTLRRVGNSDRLTLTSAAIVYPVVVVYVAGHAAAEDVPADIKGVIRTHIATRYVIRETVHEGALTPVTNLDDFYRHRGRGSPVQ